MPRRVYPNLRAYFADNEETQAQVADELEISYAYMSMLKWGTRQPDLKLALKLAQRCNVPLESLLRKAS
jgi:DNA-binding XRE family transcriptional regulator